MLVEQLFPFDGEYEFRLRIANFRGDTEAANLSPEERAKQAAERRARFAAQKKGGPHGPPCERWLGKSALISCEP